jgi:hypothetical protein
MQTERNLAIIQDAIDFLELLGVMDNRFWMKKFVDLQSGKNQYSSQNFLRRPKTGEVSRLK